MIVICSTIPLYFGSATVLCALMLYIKVRIAASITEKKKIISFRWISCLLAVPNKGETAI